ncbi:hypothetical protein [Campylobacter sputorum]|nr:hypothetical protein [Campylobacter sputorum]
MFIRKKDNSQQISQENLEYKKLQTENLQLKKEEIVKLKEELEKNYDR